MTGEAELMSEHWEEHGFDCLQMRKLKIQENRIAELEVRRYLGKQWHTPLDVKGKIYSTIYFIQIKNVVRKFV